METTPLNIQSLMATLHSAGKSISDKAMTDNGIILPQNLLDRLKDELHKRFPADGYWGIDPPDVYGPMIYALRIKQQQRFPTQHQPEENPEEPRESSHLYPADII